MIIKVCGLRDSLNISEIARLGVDWIGMIFWPRSKRYVSVPPDSLPDDVRRVGVFVDATLKEVHRHIRDYRLDFVQLHGQESPDYVRALKPFPVIKAFNIATADDLLQTEAYEGLADYFLFDTKGKAAGGNGEKFDWSVLNHYHGATPFLLSGGIGPNDAESVRSFRHPKCIGIDLNSRFEIEPALKDITRIKLFLEQLNTL
ncbi:MAG: phosphoribosylanthranilate isomerase [Prevotella sp.]|nr:phosphoribosylanthranilate isomerase [Prevotella sp.]